MLLDLASNLNPEVQVMRVLHTIGRQEVADGAEGVEAWPVHQLCAGFLVDIRRTFDRGPRQTLLLDNFLQIPGGPVNRLGWSAFPQTEDSHIDSKGVTRDVPHCLIGRYVSSLSADDHTELDCIRPSAGCRSTCSIPYLRGVRQCLSAIRRFRHSGGMKK